MQMTLKMRTMMIVMRKNTTMHTKIVMMRTTTMNTMILIMANMMTNMMTNTKMIMTMVTMITITVEAANTVILLPALSPEHAGEKNAAEAIARPGLPLRSRKAETLFSGSYRRSSAIFRHY